jgi:hypothetical protein
MTQLSAHMVVYGLSLVGLGLARAGFASTKVLDDQLLVHSTTAGVSDVRNPALVFVKHFPTAEAALRQAGLSKAESSAGIPAHRFAFASDGDGNVTAYVSQALADMLRLTERDGVALRVVG